MTLPICGVHLEKNVVLEEDKLLFQEKPCIRIGNQISKSACSFPLKNIRRYLQPSLSPSLYIFPFVTRAYTKSININFLSPLRLLNVIAAIVIEQKTIDNLRKKRTFIHFTLCALSYIHRPGKSSISRTFHSAKIFQLHWQTVQTLTNLRKPSNW